MRKIQVGLLLLSAAFYIGCGSNGPGSLFRKQSPHEQYAGKIATMGLENSTLGRAWLRAARYCLDNPLNITIPYREAGYFPADDARAVAFRFTAREGQRLSVSLTKRPSLGYQLYTDLWQLNADGGRKLLAWSDTAASTFDHEIDHTGEYILRIQPELLQSCNYTLNILPGPSLAFPVRGGKAGSFWGDNRDGGGRRHEGVDIFAAHRTPVLAAANGVITRVGENNLGGRVIFLRPDGKPYNLYYAHLDEQFSKEGDRVVTGDTLGLMGNTGNAAGGASHLHFGIYSNAGAVDPYPFVDQVVKQAVRIVADTSGLGSRRRTISKAVDLFAGPGQQAPQVLRLPANTVAELCAATGRYYRIVLPDGRAGYVVNTDMKVLKPLRSVRRNLAATPIYDAPDTLAATNSISPGPAYLNILGSFGNYYLVSVGDIQGWVRSSLL